ncbi:MAG: hypothetical protein QXX41_07945 [Nitrososphaerota archaeon]
MSEGINASKYMLSKEEYLTIENNIKQYVKGEDSHIKVIFLSCLSAKSKNPLNLFVRGESSTGKTWMVMHVVSLFPEENVWLLGNLTPKSLVHQKGIVVDENFQPIEKPKPPTPPTKWEIKENPKLREEYYEKLKKYKEEMEEYYRKLENSYVLIDMSGKILVFLDPPERETFDRLRPILSHDAEKIMYPFTDKIDGRLVTVKVVIKGWPVAIFCGAEVEWMEHIITRSLTISPTVSKEKFRMAHEVTGMRFYNPMTLKIKKKQIEEGRKIIRKIFAPYQAIIPYEHILHKIYPNDLPRTMRDYNYFLGILEAYTLLSPHPTIYSPAFAEDGFIGVLNIATISDLVDVEKIWSNIYVQTISGLSKRAIEIYDVIEELLKNDISPTVREIRKKYIEMYGISISGSTIRAYGKNLEDYGLVEITKERGLNIYYSSGKKLETLTFSFSTTVLKEFSKKELENCLDDLVNKIRDFYKTEEPYIILTPSPLNSTSYKYPFPEEAKDILYKTLISLTPQTEEESNSVSINKTKNLTQLKDVKDLSFFSCGKEAGK